jgi:anti-sigma factor RsiW
MDCVLPPKPADDELLAYLDGEADPGVTAHLERCPYCRKRAEGLARQQARLLRQLYRVACPSPHELGEYHIGHLSSTRAAEVAQHLTSCPHCTRELAQLDAFLAEGAPTREPGALDRVAQRIRVVVARLISSTAGGPRPAPALAGVRGETQGPLVYQAEGAQLLLEIQADAGHPEQRVILGLVSGLATFEGWVVHLWAADGEVASTPLDELGNFVFDGLEPGRYEMILNGPAQEIHVQELQVP